MITTFYDILFLRLQKQEIFHVLLEFYPSALTIYQFKSTVICSFIVTRPRSFICYNVTAHEESLQLGHGADVA